MRAEAGDPQYAADLLTATYRMATDCAEPSATGLMGTLIAVSGRANVQRAISAWLARGGTDPAIEVEIARRMALADARLPSAADAVEYDLTAAAHAIRGMLVSDPYWSPMHRDTYMTALRVMPGLRLRAYESFARGHLLLLDELHPGLESWNVRRMSEAQKVAYARMQSPVFPPFPSDAVASDIARFALPSLGAAVGAMYEERAAGAALRAMLAVDAYREVRGAYPETLEAACAAFGLATPLDPATGAPVRYRIENGEPVVWLVGPDAQDDGGLIPYDMEAKYGPGEDRTQVGTDMIFRLR
jgi:hypothetical protein